MKVHVLGKWCSPWQNGKLIYEEMRRQRLNVSMGVLEQPHKEILRAIGRNKPDWVFLTGSRTLPPEMLTEISKRAKLLLWDADGNSEERRKTWAERINIPDIIVTSVLGIAQEYEQAAKRIVWMPQYFDDVYHRRASGYKKPSPTFDTVFLGTLDARRRNALEKLAEKFQVAYHAKMFGPNMLYAYDQAKIAIAVHREHALKELSKHATPFLTSDRIYKALGSGIFYLTHPIEQLNLLFVPGVHLATYDGTLENLCECVEYWLCHEEERNQIAAAGQEEVLKYHTLKVRVQQYWKLMEDPRYKAPFGK